MLQILLTLVALAAAGAGVTGDRAAAATGSWSYQSAGRLYRLDLATKSETAVLLQPRSSRRLGFGGGMFTDVTDTFGGPSPYTLNLRDVGPFVFRIRTSLSFTLASGFVNSRVQPSPSGQRFAMSTRENSGLGTPFHPYLIVFDRTLSASVHLQGYRDPIWLGNDRVIAAGDDGLFIITVGTSPTVTRIGPVGLGVSSAPPSAPSLSPDGRSVAFVQFDIVWRIGLNGQGLRQVTRQHLGQTWPTWSPSGTQLAVINRDCPVSGTLQPSPEVVIISATGLKQDIANAATVRRRNGAPVRSCGPVYWLPASPTCGGKVATIVGTGRSETLRGTSRSDVIVAGGGNDTVIGAGGDDVICGGSGNDVLRGGAGKDRLFGAAGADVLNGGTARDTCDGGAGRDRSSGCEVRTTMSTMGR